MPESAIIKNTKTDLPTFSVLSDGLQISTAIQVIGVCVEECVNKISIATLTIKDGDLSKQQFEISNTDDFAPGREIKILAGYHNDNLEIYKGIVVRHSVKYANGYPSVLIIECKDPAFKMARRRQNRQFSSKPDSEIITDIINKYADVSVGTIDTTTYNHPEMVQYYATDWDFVLCRAEVNNQLVYNSAGTISVQSIPSAVTPANTVQDFFLQYGQNIFSIDAEIDVTSQLQKATCYGWDPQDMVVNEDSSETGFPDALGNLTSGELAEISGVNSEYIYQHVGVSNKTESGETQANSSELAEWAKSAMFRSSLSKICGTVKIQGTNELEIGKFVELRGVGDKFNGLAFITGIRHDIDPANWYTTVQFGINYEWFYEKHQDISEIAAAGLVPDIKGVQIGEVLSIEGDPMGIGRIKVKYPFLDGQSVQGAESQDGIWARMMTPYAGENIGIEFYPDVGSEVLLGFFNGDPRDPVVIGPLHNQVKELPEDFTPTDDNYIKGIYTASGMKLVFDDKEVSFKVETPNGNFIEITEDGDKIRLISKKSKKGIEINPDNVFVGKESGHSTSGSEAAVLGDQLYLLLKKFLQSLTVPIVPQATAGVLQLLNQPAIQQAISDLEQIRSKHVRISKD